MTETKDDQMVCKESERSDPKDAAIENALVPLNTETDVSYLIIIVYVYHILLRP